MVKIICRVKPPKENNIKIIDNTKIMLMKKDRNLLDNSIVKPYEFELDKVYDYNTTTQEIYDNEIKNKVNNKNIGIFIYGHTGSGKTYTLFGDNDNDGIFDLISKELNFNYEIQAIDIKHSGNYDLFDDKKLFIYTDRNENIKHNASSVSVTSDNYDEIKDIIYTSRINGVSKHNSNSSRSHLIIYLFDKINRITYNIIDLAGNERRPSIRSKENEKEVSFINSSLLALKECFRNYNKKFVPYRRSDLTRLLKNIITDNNKYHNIIISTIHSGFPYFFDSVDTLNYIEGLLSKVKKKISFQERKVNYNVRKKNTLDKNKDLYDPLENYIDDEIEKEINIEGSEYSDDFYSEPDLNEKQDDPINFCDDNFLDPIIYSPKKSKKIPNAFLDDGFLDEHFYKKNDENPLKLSNIFSDEINPYLVDDFALIDNRTNENDDLHNMDELVSVKDYIKILESDKTSDYKKKIFGVINNFIYKNCISNYKDLADKNLDDKKISILIMNSIATLKLVIKELQNI